MASSTKKVSSSLESPKDNAKEECMSSTAVNQFANDGSFFEMYRKRMEELQKAPNQITNSSPESTDRVKHEHKEAAVLPSSNTPSSSKATSTGSLLIQGKRKLPMGKMGGASKQLLLKKKKEEKEKELKKKEKAGEKASGWDLYMEEVKKYRETTCSEEVDRVRPLVK